MLCPWVPLGRDLGLGRRARWAVHGIGAWVVHGILAGSAGLCMVYGAWHRCMAVQAALCMGGVPDGGWIKACVYYLVGKNACSYCNHLAYYLWTIDTEIYTLKLNLLLLYLIEPLKPKWVPDNMFWSSEFLQIPIVFYASSTCLKRKKRKGIFCWPDLNQGLVGGKQWWRPLSYVTPLNPFSTPSPTPWYLTKSAK